jgi:hypothetical protein
MATTETPQAPPLDDDSAAVACTRQLETGIKFDAATEELVILQEDGLGGEDALIIVSGPNLRDFLGCIIDRHLQAFGRRATADLLGYLTDVGGIPSTKGLFDRLDGLRPSTDGAQPNEFCNLQDYSPETGARRSTNADRQRRYRERRRNAETVTPRNAETVTPRNADHNAPPLQPDLLRCRTPEGERTQ